MLMDIFSGHALPGEYVFMLLCMGAAWMTGRSVAGDWKPLWILGVYVLLLGLGARFLHFALYQAVFVSPVRYLIDTIVLGGVAYPFPGTTDFSSMLLQAQSSGAKVLGIANAGTDTINTIKQAKEFGIKMRLAGLLVFITDVHSLGLDVCQGLTLSESFYWDLNDATRAYSTRYTQRMPGRRPSMVQAGNYSCTLHYLKAAKEMGVAAAKADGAGAVAMMKKMPADDECFGKSVIREDGRKIHPAYLFEVKKPSESKGAWDYYKLQATTPGEEAFRPLGAGGCALVKA